MLEVAKRQLHTYLAQLLSHLARFLFAAIAAAVHAAAKDKNRHRFGGIGIGFQDNGLKMSDIDEGQRTVKSLWLDLLAHWRKAIRLPPMVALAGQGEMIKLTTQITTPASE